MIYQGQYIEELTIFFSGYFLLSGGGNDFVGEKMCDFISRNPDNKGNETASNSDEYNKNKIDISKENHTLQ